MLAPRVCLVLGSLPVLGCVLVASFSGALVAQPPLGDTIQVATGARLESAAMGASDEFIVVWRKPAMGTGGNLVAQRFDGRGGRIGSAIQVTGDLPILSSASTGMDQQGDFVVVWQSSSGVLLLREVPPLAPWPPLPSHGSAGRRSVRAREQLRFRIPHHGSDGRDERERRLRRRLVRVERRWASRFAGRLSIAPAAGSPGRSAPTTRGSTTSGGARQWRWQTRLVRHRCGTIHRVRLLSSYLGITGARFSAAGVRLGTEIEIVAANDGRIGPATVASAQTMDRSSSFGPIPTVGCSDAAMTAAVADRPRLPHQQPQSGLAALTFGSNFVRRILLRGLDQLRSRTRCVRTAPRPRRPADRRRARGRRRERALPTRPHGSDGGRRLLLVAWQSDGSGSSSVLARVSGGKPGGGGGDLEDDGDGDGVPDGAATVPPFAIPTSSTLPTTGSAMTASRPTSSSRPTSELGANPIIGSGTVPREAGSLSATTPRSAPTCASRTT